MSRHNYSWDENKIKRYLKEKRGQGKGREYKPWITIHDFPSKGFSSRAPGWKSDRVYHFLSGYELKFFYLLEWSDCVVDIKEQFPLLDIEDAMGIAESIDIQYPIDNESKLPFVLSTDFMVTIDINGKKTDIARTIKPSPDLEKRRVIEKYEIEKRYWAKRSIDWGIVTEKELPQILVKNIEWVHSSYRLEPSADLSTSEMMHIADILKQQLRQDEAPIRHVTSKLDKDLGIEPGTSLYIFKHLLAVKDIHIDMNKKIDVSKPLNSIREPGDEQGKVMLA